MLCKATGGGGGGCPPPPNRKSPGRRFAEAADQVREGQSGDWRSWATDSVWDLLQPVPLRHLNDSLTGH